MNLKKEKKPREKAHIIKNTLFMLGCAFKSAPLSLFIIYFSYITENVYYSVVINVMFLETALSVIEGNGTFAEFVIRICIIIFGKLFVDLLGYIDVYTIRVKFEIKCESYINSLIFKKAQEVELGCYENPEFFDDYNRATWVVDRGGFKRIIEGSAWTLGSLISLIFLVIYLMSIDPILIVFILCPVVVVIFRVLKNNLELEKEKEMTPYERQKDYVRRTILLKDFAKEIKTTNIFVVMEKRFKQAISKNIDVIKKYGWKIAILEIISDYFAEIVPIGGGFIYGCYRLIVLENLPVSEFSVLVSAITTCRNKIGHLARYFAMQQKHCLWVQNLRNFLEYEPQIKSGTVIPEDFESIEFKNVSFRYTEDMDYIIKNVSFKIQKGQTVAVVGHNGAGKTTLSKLLMRLYDVTEGEILYNGRNIKEYDLLKYREKFAAVFQDYKVFAMTVSENVLTEEVTDENKEIAVNALKMSGAYEKIGRLPEKENSLLTKEFDKEGVLLSGGETQKVTIARLFARDFSVAVLDEPSSALDPVAESRMYDALMEGTKGKTVIYISHRLSSATHSDKILVFNKGKLTEQGTHEELIAKNGEYAEMFTLQASGYTQDEEVSDIEE
ncbi:MAG: ABC transporter ATP-binding protein [Ruminococcaceae bacterium]|nr:ABC transporter ATP-binding protein [Oscillospiraceae bacterium]